MNISNNYNSFNINKSNLFSFKQNKKKQTKLSCTEILLGTGLLASTTVAGVAIHKNNIAKENLKKVSKKLEESATKLKEQKKKTEDIKTKVETKLEKNIQNKKENHTSTKIVHSYIVKGTNIPSLAEQVLKLQIEKIASIKPNYKKIIDSSISHKPTKKQHLKKLAELKEAFGIKNKRKTKETTDYSELKKRFQALLNEKDSVKQQEEAFKKLLERMEFVNNNTRKHVAEEQAKKKVEKTKSLQDLANLVDTKIGFNNQSMTDGILSYTEIKNCEKTKLLQHKKITELKEKIKKILNKTFDYQKIIDKQISFPKTQKEHSAKRKEIKAAFAEYDKKQRRESLELKKQELAVKQAKAREEKNRLKQIKQEEQAQKEQQAKQKKQESNLLNKIKNFFRKFLIFKK